ncbi:MAG: XrtA system polysaccharide deacetylase [Bacteroidota bacterium]
MSKIINALTVDLEDWFCVYNFRGYIVRTDWEKCESRIEQNTDRLLNLFDKHNVKATFFVLGWVAERVPDLIKKIDSAGHEIASHGYSHQLVTEMTRESFAEDLKKSLDILYNIIQKEVIGFRAPSFSITNKTLWALDILEQQGIKYDSSIYPTGYHPDYGIADFPLSPQNVTEKLVEFPMSCSRIGGIKIPCSGGGYFRSLPYSVTKYLFNKINLENRSFVFYIHPWEIDPQQPRIRLPLAKSFRHYNNLGKTYRRIDMLLSDFSFTTIRKVLQL